jgi:hypothetical protein
MVALALIQMLMYGTYVEAYASDQPYTVLMLIFPFWSLISSYAGVRTMFQVSRWKARLWFIVFPGLIYVVVLGVIAVLFSVFEA